jgi:hypothetical protein
MIAAKKRFSASSNSVDHVQKQRRSVKTSTTAARTEYGYNCKRKSLLYSPYGFSPDIQMDTP